MDRRRVILTAAVVATVGAAAALTLPSFADTERRSPGPASPSVSPKLLEAMQRDLDLNEGQARARLARDAAAAKAAKDLRKQMGSSWGGAWIGDDGQMTVGTTDPGDAEKINKAGARAKVVGRSSEQLDRAKKSLDKKADAAGSSIVGWYVDPATNQLVVRSTARNPNSLASFLDAAGVPAEMVRVESARSVPRLLAEPTPGPAGDQLPPGQQPGKPGVRDGQKGGGQKGDDQQGDDQQDDDQQDDGQGDAAGGAQEIRGGDAFVVNGNARCTVGFAVEGGFLSAGHCGEQGDTTEALANGNPQEQGVFAASAFPDDDFSFVRTNADFTPVGVVQSFGGRNEPVVSNQFLVINGSAEAPIGTTVCKFGSTTGASCGVIQQLNATVQFADPDGGADQVTINGLIGTDVCAEAGDSGGPLLAGDQAQGTVSGGSGDCDAGGETFFQPVNEALDRLGLTLLTTVQ